VAEDRVADGRLAEQAGKGNVLGVIEMLAAEEDDLPLDPRIANLAAGFGRQPCLEIDAGYFGADT